MAGVSARPVYGVHPYAEEVNYSTASRRGEPYFTLLKWLKAYRADQGLDAFIPTPTMRADEPRRLSNAKDETRITPLATAGVVKKDVLDFWANNKQGFDLQLNPETSEGNCTYCFMKPLSAIVPIMRKTKEHDWFWLEAEALTGKQFRTDRSYTDLRRRIDAGLPIKGVDDEATGDCFCGDGS